MRRIMKKSKRMEEKLCQLIFLSGDGPVLSNLLQFHEFPLIPLGVGNG